MLDPLTGLDGDYKILGELHRTFGSVTYLARNLHLLRDVTVTVVPISAAGGRSTLTQLSTDTRLFIGLRNPNIIPVLEGRWLGRNAFAVVRARVRGSTLAELLGTVGAVPMLRVHSTLEQVYPTLLWARENKIGLRHVSPEWVVFQQGSGRALLALDVPPSIEPPATGSHTEGTEDVRMLGRLARVMLSGKSDAGEQITPLQELRSDLSPKVALAADALAAGEWGGEDDVIQFLNLLLQTAGGSTDPTSATPRGTTSIMSPSRSTMSITTPPAGIAPPLAHPHAESIEPPAAPPQPQPQPEPEPEPEPEPDPVMASAPEPEPVADESEQPRLTFDPEEPREEDSADDDDKPISRHTAPRRIVSPESGVPRVIPPLPTAPAPHVKPGGTVERSAVRPPLSPFPPAPPAAQAPPSARPAAPPVPPTPVEEPPPEAIEPPIPARTIERPGPKRTPVQSVDATPIRIVEQVAPPTIDKSLSLILEPPSARLTSTQGPPTPPTAHPPVPPAPPARHSGSDLKITHIEEPNAAFPPPQQFAPPPRAGEAADNPDDDESMPRTMERPAASPSQPRPSGKVQSADAGTGTGARSSKQSDIPVSWPLESTGTPPVQPPPDDAGPFIAKTTTDPRGRPPTPRGSTAMPSSDDLAPPSSPPPPTPRVTPPPPAARQTPPQPAPPRVTPPRVTPPPSTPVRQSAAAELAEEKPDAPTKPKRQRPPRKIHIPVREIVMTLVVAGVIGGALMGSRAFLQSRRDAADSVRVRKERADSTELAEAAKLAPKTKGKKSTSDSTNIGADVPSVGPGGDVCGSRSLIDQRTCFTNSTQRVDSAMTHVLTTLVATLRKQAHIGAADNDPPIVDRLKSEQRAWAADRDHACPAIGSLELSGRARAQCFADHAAKRAKDLQQQLDAIPPI